MGDNFIGADTESIEINENQLNSQKEILESQRAVYQKIRSGEDVSKIKISVNFSHIFKQSWMHIQATKIRSPIWKRKNPIQT